MNTQTFNPSQKKKISKLNIAVYILAAVFALYFAAAIGATLDYATDRNGTVDFSVFGNNITRTISSPGAVFTALGEGGRAAQILFLAAMAIGIYVLYKYSTEKKRLHRRRVEHGSAKWGDEKEMQELKDVGKDSNFPHDGKNDTKFIPFKSHDGKRVYDNDGEIVGIMVDNNIVLTEQVYLSLNSRQHFLNLHVLIIGGSGAGKTRFFAKPNILQLNTSYVITDPKGEILRDVGSVLVGAGYDLKVVNLIEMEHSNNYNPFNYVYDFKGNLSQVKLTQMIEMFMSTTKGEGEKDDFWSSKAKELIQAIILLLFEESEYNGELDENGVIKPESRDFSSLNFYSVTEKMLKLVYPPQGKEDGFFISQNDGEADEAFKARQDKAHLCPLDKDFLELEKREKSKISKRDGETDEEFAERQLIAGNKSLALRADKRGI